MLRLFITASLLFATRAGAQESDTRARIEFRDAVVPCSSFEDVRDRLISRLGYDPHDESSSRVIQIEVGAEEAIVDLREGTELIGSRRVHGRTCLELVDRVTFAVAVLFELVEPAQAEAPADAATATIPKHESQLVLRETTPPVSTNIAADAPPGVRVALRAGLGASLFELPEVVPSIFVGMALRFPTFSFAIDLAYASMFARASFARGVQLGIDRVAGAAAFCGHVMRVDLCATFRIGIVDLESNTRLDGSNQLPFAAVGFSPSYAVPLDDDFRIVIGAHFLVPVWRPRISFAGDDVWQAPLVTIEPFVSLRTDL